MTDEAPVRGRAGMSEKERAMSDPREALGARQRGQYGELWDVLVPEVGWTPGRIIESVIEDALPDAHDHKWQWRQNVTSRGYRMTPYEVCVVDGCGAARQVDEPAALMPAPPAVKPTLEQVVDVLAAQPPGRGEWTSSRIMQTARAVLALFEKGEDRG